MDLLIKLNNLVSQLQTEARNKITYLSAATKSYKNQDFKLLRGTSMTAVSYVEQMMKCPGLFVRPAQHTSTRTANLLPTN